MDRLRFVVAIFVNVLPIVVRKNVGADTRVILKPQTYHYDHWSGCYSPIYGRHVTEMSQIGWFSRLCVRDSWPISTCIAQNVWADNPVILVPHT